MLGALEDHTVPSMMMAQRQRGDQEIVTDFRRNYVRWIVPPTLNIISSVTEDERRSAPPGIAPEAALVLAAVIASRRVQKPSLASVSASESTVSDAAATGAATRPSSGRG